MNLLISLARQLFAQEITYFSLIFFYYMVEMSYEIILASYVFKKIK